MVLGVRRIINMKKYEYVEIETKGLLDRIIKDHRKLIDEYAEKGYRYAGYIPTKITPSGCLLAIDLIFEIDR